MLIIGFYLSQADFKKAFIDKGVYFSLAVRLIALPMITAVVMSLCRVTPIITMACVIATSAPTAATTTMFATKFNKDVELSVSIVAATTVFSLATMPLVVMLTGMMSGFSS